MHLNAGNIQITAEIYNQIGSLKDDFCQTLGWNHVLNLALHPIRKGKINQYSEQT